MSVLLPIYSLPKAVKREILLDCYNTLIEKGMSKEDARYKISHEIVCARLLDMNYLVDIYKYHL